MAIKFYGYSKCSTCRKAQQFLEHRKLTYENLDITQEPPSLKELKAMLDAVSGQVKRLFNTSGQVYRELELGKKLDALSGPDALKLLASNGRLVKRPFLVVDGKPVAVGFDEKAWSALL